MKYVYTDGGRRAEYGMKPLKKYNSGDCVVRSIAQALGQSYRDTFRDLLDGAYRTGFMPNEGPCYGEYLQDRGWVKSPPLRRPGGGLYRLHELAAKPGTALIHTRRHLTLVRDHTIYDTWNCQYQWAYSYWTPQRA